MITEFITVVGIFVYFFVSICLFVAPFAGLKYLLDQVGGRK